MSTKQIEASAARPLKLIEAVKAHLRFRRLKEDLMNNNTAQPDFGHSICFSLDTMNVFIDEATNYLRKQGVERKNRGIAFYNIINGSTTDIPQRLHNKPSIMMVASHVEPLDDSGKVNYITNVIEAVIEGLEKNRIDDFENLTLTKEEIDKFSSFEYDLCDVGNRHP